MKNCLRLFCAALLLMFVSVLPVRAEGELILVLDPGHDWTDAGARRTWDGVSYEEETIVLKMARACKKELETYAGVKVYLTRNTNDVSMDRYDRVKIARELEADALVSIHINSTVNQEDTVSGALAYVPTYGNKAPYAVKARALASDIVNHLSTIGMKNLGFLEDENLGIIYYGKLWKIPTMIIEHGFVNNPKDCKKYYGSNSKIRRVGRADATAIARHYGLVKKSGWQRERGNWVYLDSNGIKMTGWQDIDGQRYYFDESGYKVTGFCKISGKKYYFNEEGILCTGFLQVGQARYWAKNNGAIRTGWFLRGGKRYYAAESGKLHRGFTEYEGNTYYFDRKTAAAQIGWQMINRKYYYFDSTGCMQTGWTKIGDKYYYFRSTGVRRTGWLKYKGMHCYLDKKTGEKLTSRWIKVKGKYYYLKKSGVRVENATRIIKGVKYRFGKDGVCLNKK